MAVILDPCLYNGASLTALGAQHLQQKLKNRKYQIMARIVEHREVSYYRDTQKLFGFYYEYMYHVSQIKTIQSSNFLWWGCKIVGQPDLFQC